MDFSEVQKRERTLIFNRRAIVNGYDLDLMSVATTNDVLDEGRSLVVVALVGTDLHIRIFDASREKVVDKAENELISGEALTALKLRLNPLPDESSLSPEDKREIIENATSSAGHTLVNKQAIPSDRGSSARPYEPFDDDLFGLALSGGGIRSATFNLGILQWLAKHKLIRRIDYLSTVSGGGYIGGWLTGMFHREGGKQLSAAVANDVVEERLSGENLEHSSTENNEDRAIRWLRGYSNYLTPRVGMFSTDTWAAIATYFRNLLLNLLLLFSSVVFLLLFSHALATVVKVLPTIFDIPPALSLATFVVLLPPAVITGKNLAWFDNKNVAADKTPTLFLRMVTPMVIAAFFATFWLPGLRKDDYLPWVLWVGVAHLFAWLIAFASAVWSINKAENDSNTKQRIPLFETAKSLLVPDRGGEKQSVWWKILVWGFISGLLMGLLLRLFVDLINPANPTFIRLTIGPPLILFWLYLLAVLHTGLLGKDLNDQAREWLSRVGALLIISALAWLSITSLSFYGGLIIDSVSGFVMTALTSGWLLTAIGGLLASRSYGDDAAVGVARRLLMSVAPYIFVLGLFLWISWASTSILVTFNYVVENSATATAAEQDYGRKLKAYSESSAKNGEGQINLDFKQEKTDLEFKGSFAHESVTWNEVKESFVNRQSRLHESLSIIVVLACFILIRALLGWRFDVHEFSLHRFYGHRLARCYLGASVENRKPQPFTHFSDQDDIRLNELKRDKDSVDNWRNCIPGPYPIINTAINLVASREALALQERKAASFFLSPLFCGFKLPHNDGEDIECFRQTEEFASDPEPLTLGGAMTTSGAAASPNMGARTTGLFAFLLTVFNVRLGRWIGNPNNDKKWKKSTPGMADMYLLAEITGSTHSESEFVYLSDGGHFENLGIYELVRRKCRFIVVCDAGADSQLKFDDLGNAIRKCRTDFGYEIDIRTDQIERLEDDRYSGWHCAIGTIDYDPTKKGILLYIKASLPKDAPKDVLNYAVAHPTFPHQSTGDQFFTESQFESYRRLGYHIADKIFAVAVNENLKPNETKLNIERLFTSLKYQWHAPREDIGGNFTDLTKTLDTLLERLRTSDKLAFLGHQFYPEWRTASPTSADHLSQIPTETDEFKEGFYFCNSLIQLMENVYIDLNLEAEHEHPDNRGWMNLFHHWSWSNMFRVTWAISAATYGIRFQRFCKRELALELGEVGWCKKDHPAYRPSSVEQRQIDKFLDQQIQDLCIMSAGDSNNEQELIRKFKANCEEKEYTCAILIVGLATNATKKWTIAGFNGEGEFETVLIDDAANELFIELEKEDVDKNRILEIAASNLGRTYLEPYQSFLAVKPAVEDGNKTLTRLDFGYAILDGDKLIMLRVRDHLRKMGLGRDAILELLKEKVVREFDPKVAGEVLNITSEAKIQLQRMFKSAEKECQ